MDYGRTDYVTSRRRSNVVFTSQNPVYSPLLSPGSNFYAGTNLQKVPPHRLGATNNASHLVAAETFLRRQSICYVLNQGPISFYELGADRI